MPLIPRLVALAGLPGVGKSTAAEAIARELDAVVVSVDPIEDALHRAGLAPSFETGLAAYLAAEVVARDALRLGRAVVVDAANYVEPARAQWRSLAAQSGAELQWVEVVCSDEGLHRERLGARDRGFGPSLERVEVEARHAVKAAGGVWDPTTSKWYLPTAEAHSQASAQVRALRQARQDTRRQQWRDADAAKAAKTSGQVRLATSRTILEPETTRTLQWRLPKSRRD